MSSNLAVSVILILTLFLAILWRLKSHLLASTTNISTDETLSASGDESIQPYQDEPLANKNGSVNKLNGINMKKTKYKYCNIG